MRLSLDVVRGHKRQICLVWFFLTYMLEDELHNFKETISKPNMPFCKEVVNQSIL